MVKSKIDWIASVLLNDEGSTDDEMIEHFILEGKITREEATYYVSQRIDALRYPFQFEIVKF